MIPHSTFDVLFLTYSFFTMLFFFIEWENEGFQRAALIALFAPFFMAGGACVAICYPFYYAGKKIKAAWRKYWDSRLCQHDFQSDYRSAPRCVHCKTKQGDISCSPG